MALFRDVADVVAKGSKAGHFDDWTKAKMKIMQRKVLWLGALAS